jgi:hypothetical protein
MKQMLKSYSDKKFSVIPLQPRSKKPSLKWQTYNHRRPTDEEIVSWFGGAAERNIGIVTGPISGLVVVDIDDEKGFNFVAAHGGLPPTPTVITAKGKHFYFKHSGSEISNSVKKLPGIDIRSKGGFVVAPPSIHENGHVYTWDISLDEVPLANLPEWLLAALADEPNDLKANATSVSKSVPRSIKDEVNNLLGSLMQAKVGGRNDTLNATAFQLGQFVGAGQLERAWIETKLNDIAAFLGLDEKEAFATVASGLDAGITRPREQRPIFEILDKTPDIMDRPLRMIGPHTYGVTWVPIGEKGSAGNKAQTEIIILRDDGVSFCESDIPGTNSIDELPVLLDLPHRPSSTKLLSPQGLKRFMEGKRPNPAEVFAKVVDCIDAFVSFEGSLADQRPMCELAAGWIMSTYCLDAFHVVGYLWPIGEKGSGKTQFLNTVSTLAYLGRTITSGSSFASIRDEAHYGATIAFDDCEDVRRLDTEKRELLLAGNTRGTTISLKELVGEIWKTRYVNNFAPRLFSSIGLPDDVLSSRTISVPLVASVDKSKTRRSPARNSDWPHSISELIDDLWLLGITSTHRIHECDAEASTHSNLEARNHDIWRPILAIAFWLQNDHGVAGLFDRLTVIAESYHDQSLDYRGFDNVTLLLQAAYRYVATAGYDVLTVSTADLVAAMISVAEEYGEPDQSDITVQRVGRLLSNLRFDKSRSHGKSRAWKLPLKQIQTHAAARGIKLDAPIQERLPEDIKDIRVATELLHC